MSSRSLPLPLPRHCARSPFSPPLQRLANAFVGGSSHYCERARPSPAPPPPPLPAAAAAEAERPPGKLQQRWGESLPHPSLHPRRKARHGLDAQKHVANLSLRQDFDERPAVCGAALGFFCHHLPQMLQLWGFCAQFGAAWCCPHHMAAWIGGPKRRS